MSEKSKPAALLVDDDESVLAAVAGSIRNEFDVTKVTSGSEALVFVRTQGPFQVIISDMNMPGMSGVEFLAEAHKLSPWSVKMLLTGDADLETAVAAVNQGRVFRFLNKPCTPDELRAAFREALAEFHKGHASRNRLQEDKDRIATRMLKTQRLALLGDLAQRGAGELLSATTSYGDLLEQATAKAASGGWVSVEDLHDLGFIKDVLRRFATRIVGLESADKEQREANPFLIANTAVSRMRGTTPDSVEVKLTREPDVPNVFVAPDMIEHAIANLAMNALEAVALVKEEREGRVTVSVRFDSDADAVLCEVIDNGNGVHPETRPYIFGPFFSTKGVDRPGLGLTVAQNLVECSGGTLTFDSKFREGSTFRISLPAYSSAADTQSSRKEP